MNNFTYDIKTKVYFGKGQISHLGEETALYGKKALLVYGGGSIKKNGLYEEAMKEFKNHQIEVVELSGVEPNPRIETVRKGVELCRKHNIDVIVAIGGGSTIDCAKIISGSVSYDKDPWDIVLDASKVTSCLPILTVLTLAATGSEMDAVAVISDMSKNEKWGCGHPGFRPVVSILDPTYTFSVSKYQTACGTADIMSHIMESYFTNTEGFMQDRIAEGLLRTCIAYGLRAVKQPDDYEARANLMWTGSWAINDLLKLGKGCPWSVHPMEHELSAFYDITHGAGLAILTPYWMEYVLDETSVDKFVDFARNVWQVSPHLEDEYAIAKEGIKRLRDFFVAMGLPTTLHEVGINEEHFDIMAEKASKKLQGGYRNLTKEDVINIYKKAL